MIKGPQLCAQACINYSGSFFKTGTKYGEAPGCYCKKEGGNRFHWPNNEKWFGLPIIGTGLDNTSHNKQDSKKTDNSDQTQVNGSMGTYAD